MNVSAPFSLSLRSVNGICVCHQEHKVAMPDGVRRDLKKNRPTLQLIRFLNQNCHGWYSFYLTKCFHTQNVIFIYMYKQYTSSGNGNEMKSVRQRTGQNREPVPQFYSGAFFFLQFYPAGSREAFTVCVCVCVSTCDIHPFCKNHSDSLWPEQEMEFCTWCARLSSKTALEGKGGSEAMTPCWTEVKYGGVVDDHRCWYSLVGGRGGGGGGGGAMMNLVEYLENKNFDKITHILAEHTHTLAFVRA